MPYEHFWVKVAAGSDRGSSVRIVERSRDLPFFVVGEALRLHGNAHAVGEDDEGSRLDPGHRRAVR